jgi:type II secretory pathway pseudopilin PulG
MGCRERQRARRRSGFTIVEAMVSISLAALAASVLLLGINATVGTTDEAMNKTIALGMARQLIDEVVGTRYLGTGDTAYDAALKPSPSQAATGTRALFTDNADFNGFRSSGAPVDPWGKALGQDDGFGGLRPASFQADAQMFSRWRQEIDVYYVAEADHATPASGPTDYRAVEARIVYLDPQRGPLVLVKLRRVIAYVPPLP